MITALDIKQRAYLARIWTLLAPRYADGTLSEFGGGRVFFVKHYDGDDTDIGTEPSHPWRHIAYAISQCDHNRDDYIFVLDCWDDEDTFPIVVDKDRVHIIGVANPSCQLPKINTGGVAAAIFQLGDGTNGAYCEIAGFDMMALGVHGCIECNQARGGWIHDCQFGHDQAMHAGSVCDYGIWLAGGNSQGLLVEDCHFFGWDKLALVCLAYGIYGDALGVHRADYAQYRRNIFQTCRTAGIYFEGSTGMMIMDNTFACVAADAEGSAITLAAGGGGVCDEGLIAGNRALYGPATSGMSANPYLDQNVAPSTPNSWMQNYKGNALIDPV